MKVKIATRLYKMSRKEYENLRDNVAKEQVPLGIYAVEKRDYAELKNDRCNSITQLKQRIRAYKSQGFKVYSNGRW